MTTIKTPHSSSSPQVPDGLSRRQLLGTLGTVIGASLLGPAFNLAQEAGSVLPLDTPGLDHLDIIVPDVEASARFYMSLFSTRLHAQPFRGAFRYFVLLGQLNEKREVGYLAIGASNGRGTYIGHFCTSVANWREDSAAIWEAMATQIDAAGLGAFPGASGFGGIFTDPDGIEIQFLPSPDTLVTAATPSDLADDLSGLVTPLGVDHVQLNVSNLDQAVRYYRILYGQESGRDAVRAWFDFPRSGTRLLLHQREYAYGGQIGIDHFGVRTAGFDRGAVQQRLSELGAALLPPGDDPDALRFSDLDGITVELKAVNA